MKKLGFLICFCLIICITAQFFAFSVFSADDDTPEAEPAITSGNLVVVRSVETNQILMDYGGNTTVAPTVASKLVTAMVVYDMMPKLDQIVTVPAEALLVRNTGDKGLLCNPSIGLTVGEKYSAADLMAVGLVSSANDVFFSLAYHVSGGNITAFVPKMNEKAKEIGCADTLFTSPVGLQDKDPRKASDEQLKTLAHTTPKDVSLIAAAFYKYDTLLNMSNKEYYTFGNKIQTKNYVLSDNLIKGCKIDGALGMAAGQARSDGGYALITSTQYNGLSYVYVIMEASTEIRTSTGIRMFGDKNAYDDLKLIFDWASKTFEYYKLDTARAQKAEIDVKNGDSDYVSCVIDKEVEVLLPKGTDVETEIGFGVVTLNYTELEAPVKKDTVVGKIEYYYDGKVVAEANLVTNFEVSKDQLISWVSKLRSFILSDTVKKIVKILLIGLGVYILLLLGTLVYKAVKKANAIKRRREVQKLRAESRAAAEREMNLSKSDDKQNPVDSADEFASDTSDNSKDNADSPPGLPDGNKDTK